MATDPEKTNKVSKWPIPTTISDVQRFLGLASYYRWFVKNYATIASPLHKLTERGRQFNWTSECATAFASLKQKLTYAPILAFPDFTQPFLLDTDASHFGIGAVLSQVVDGKENVIAYASRTLSKAERKYCVTQKELLAMVIFIRHFRPYLLGRQFTLRTDHSALKWLQTLKEPEGQLARWLEQLQEYEFEIIHRAGKRHSNADALSRRPACSRCNRDDCVQSNPGCTIEQVQEQSPAINALQEEDTSPVTTAESTSTDTSHNEESDDIRDAQLNDDVLGPILQLKETNQQPEEVTLAGMGHEAGHLHQQWPQLIVQDGVLYRKVENQDGHDFYLQLVVPRS